MKEYLAPFLVIPLVIGSVNNIDPDLKPKRKVDSIERTMINPVISLPINKRNKLNLEKRTLTINNKQSEHSYKKVLEDITQKREKFNIDYEESTPKERKEVIRKSRDYLINTLTKKVFPYWYGTPWSFNGHTEQPKNGSIACGFFVGTILRDIGFNIDRIRLGIQPSEYIIKNLTDENNIERFSNKSVENVVNKIKVRGKGIYIVGLDFHTGFIFYDGKTKPKFVHSSYYEPFSVVSENIDSDNPLRDSRYRVIGKIFNETMLKKWIKGEKFQIYHDYFKKK